MARRRAGVVHAWVFERDGEKLGPVPEPGLKKMIVSGDVTGDTAVWRQGMPDWLPLRETELSRMLGNNGRPTDDAVSEVAALEEAARVRKETETKDREPLGELRSVRLQGRIFRGCLGVYSAITFVNIIACVMLIYVVRQILDGADATTGSLASFADLADQIAIYSSAIYTLSYLTTVVAYGIFYHRAMRNLHNLRSPDAEMAPAGMWAWYIVPIASLWKPFEGVLQVWRGSMTASGQDPRVPAMIGFWWTFWIAGLVCSGVERGLTNASGINTGAPNLDTLMSALWASAIASAFLIVAATLLFLFSSRVADAQERLRDGSVADVFS
ncbi:MAG: DUF4328 domain-containing protein [Pseudomonadota bacterium]